MIWIVAVFGLVGLIGLAVASGDAVAQIATNEAQRIRGDRPTRSAP